MDKDTIVLILLLKSYIQNNNSKSLQDLIQKLPLDSLSVKTSDTLLAELLNTCEHYERAELMLLIYNTWKSGNPEEGKFSLYTYMFTKEIFTDKVLGMLAPHLEETSVTLFDELKVRDDSDENLVAISRIFNILGRPTNESLEVMLKEIKDLEFQEDVPAPRLRSFIEDLIKETADFQVKPSYMLDPEEGEELPSNDELEDINIKSNVDIDSLSDDQKIDLMTKGMDVLGLSTTDIEKTKKAMKTNILSLSKVDQKVLLLSVVKSLEFEDLTDNTELFRTFGPSHINSGFTNIDDSDNAYPCSRYGGCRMLLCVCIQDKSPLDQDDDFDVIEDDELEAQELKEWYKGACDFCNKRIVKKCYAFRRPHDTGGWFGCYCSPACCRNDVPIDDENTNVLVIHTLIDTFEENLKLNGIYDRTY